MSALARFKDRLVEFANGQRQGIRNPFIMVPVKPAVEQKAAQRLFEWTPENDAVSTKSIFLDRVMPQTDVFQTLLGLPDSFYENGTATNRPYREKQTLRDNLAEEMVAVITAEHAEECHDEQQILLLLHLGALYPFARASELLDEMDRRQVRATIGIPFPGKITNRKLSFFGERAHHYYPAHRIEGRIAEAELQ
jgi:hypothetical protein